MDDAQERKIATEVREGFEANDKKLRKSYGKDIEKYLKNNDDSYMYGKIEDKPDSFGLRLRKHLAGGGKPSEFFKANMSKMKGYIADELLPYFYRSVDSVNEWQADYRSYYRKSYKGLNDYSLYLRRFPDIIEEYRQLTNYEVDIYSLLKGELPERLDILFRRSIKSNYTPYYIAARLDEGDEKLEEIITDIFLGDTGTVGYELIRGIFLSKNTRMFEVLGKTLVAARLSEGLRQSICENMDYGTKEGFLYILNVILENNLIRFSSVKRAIGTFTGLFPYESKDVDRMSEKQLRLIVNALSDDKAVEEMLKSEDAVEIYIALWAIGFVDIKTAFDRAKKLCEEGSRHQRLVATYFVYNSEMPYVRNGFAKNIVKQYKDDDELMATAMPIFMPRIRDSIYSTLYKKGTNRYSEKDEKKHRVYVNLGDYFESEEECREYNDILYSMLDRIPKKGFTFEPSVFPWHKASLTSSDVAIRIVFCASALKDEELIIKAAGLLKEINNEYGYRTDAIELLLREPDSPELLDILTQEVSDADSSSRDVAYSLLKQEMEEDRSKLSKDIASPAGRLHERSYMILEDMLRLKRAEVRNNVLSLLVTRGPEEKLEMFERLFKDGKEEKVTAGLDMIMQMKKSDDESFGAAAELVKSIKKPTTKEKILIDEIIGTSASENEELVAFYDKNAEYEPVVDEDYLAEALEAFYSVFPESDVADVISPKKKGLGEKIKKITSGLKKSEDVTKAITFVKGLDELIEANKDREFNSWNGTTLLGNSLSYEYVDGKSKEIAFKDLWDGYIAEHEISDGLLLSIKMCYQKTYYYNEIMGYMDYFKPLLAKLYGPLLNSKDFKEGKYSDQISCVIDYYIRNREVGKETAKYISAITMLYLNRTKESTEYSFTADKYVNEWSRRNAKEGEILKRSILAHPVILEALTGISSEPRNFPIQYEWMQGIVKKHYEGKSYEISNYSNGFIGITSKGPHPLEYISAVLSGYISKDFMYKMLLDEAYIKVTLTSLSNVAKYIYESDITVASRGGRFSWYNDYILGSVETLLRINVKKLEKLNREELTEVQEQKLKLAEECYKNISGLVMNTELVRGDTETEYSQASLSLKRVYGAEYLVRILSALGEETLDRTSYFYSYSSRAITKRESLSHLLSICIPDPRDGDTKAQTAKLKELLKNTDIKEQRLIEAGLYSPEWLPIIGQYLGWEGFMSGCYYFMAHMNEKFDDKRAAIIAKYTPLTEEELNVGAFDTNWFNDVYKTLGKKRFDAIYKAAKYISDGSKHTRARKYADAARGDMDPVKTAEDIEKKRNKDLLMAYALIPCKEKEKKDRYSFIQKYQKESKQFGAQRRASEKAAAEMAVKNMATASGYSDETRFILKMEREISSGLSMYFEPKDVEGYLVALEPDDAGKITLAVKKGEKTLKSVPAAIKKKDYIVDITEAKKAFTEQYRRTRIMMEEAMECETEFLVSEILDMSSDKVIGPMINKVLFKQDDFFGFPEDIREEGLKASSNVVVAHPYHLFTAGRWREFQKICFDKEIKQPFKQIFRELYVKTDEEKDIYDSVRYAGNQINPKQTVGVLRNRRWIADAEDGLQKVYYKENIIATIYALADWFSPSDIEAPTLEWVCFYDRKTFKKKPISEIPEILFSEVMRDVDLAVSVAHAGDVDPEMSHSTIEMRRAIAEFVVPMFKLKNVTFTDSHAIIKGERGSYNIHLGSGVIHQEGGPMINVLPVHSQHRGRIFLPFVDDDPKTAEIMSKIIFFAEDKKIKDPFILDQIV